MLRGLDGAGAAQRHRLGLPELLSVMETLPGGFPVLASECHLDGATLDASAPPQVVEEAA